MAHTGFDKLKKKIEESGKSSASAGAIAAAIGRKKYGKAKMAEAAKKGKPLKESQKLKK